MKPSFGTTRRTEAYLDNAATTEIDPDVVSAMRPYLEENYGNPETLYHLGRQAKEGVDVAREQVAELFDCQPERVFFTSGGTEANNWALKSICDDQQGKTLVISFVEHASISKAAGWLASRRDIHLVIVDVDKTGMVNLDVLKAALAPGDIRMVSIQHVNNELGTIQDLKAISELVHEAGAVFHVDAVQSFGKIAVHPDDWLADLVSVSAHKIHGPMGIGALYIRDGLEIPPFMHGGHQENGMRAGTLPVHQIVGFGAAAERARCTMATTAGRLEEFAAELETQMKGRCGAVRNGHPTSRIPHILSLTIPDVEGTLLAAVLNEKYGICIACGAACSRGQPSHVLSAIGLSDEMNRKTIRISMGRLTTQVHIRSLWMSIQAAIKMAKDRELI